MPTSFIKKWAYPDTYIEDYIYTYIYIEREREREKKKRFQFSLTRKRHAV